MQELGVVVELPEVLVELEVLVALGEQGDLEVLEALEVEQV